MSLPANSASPIPLFLSRLSSCLADGTFHKLALGKPGPGQEFTGISGRLVDLKAGPCLSLTCRRPRGEEVRNLPLAEVEAGMALFLQEFRQADLFTAAGSVHLLYNNKREPRLLEKKAVVTQAPDRTHNRTKARRLDLTGQNWPQALGLTAKKDKLVQIEKFLEIVDGLLPDQPPAGVYRIADLGAGKGYLSFALYQFLTVGKGWTVELEAVEVQPHLVEQGNQTAAAAGFSGLKFIASRIDQVPVKPLDMVIVLHACDTATDDALNYAVRSQATLIFAAPCCHQELRSRLTARGGLEAVLRSGILLERQAEILTDGLRSLVLETRGYKTRVMEFVPAEHSGKNLMIVAQSGPAPDPATLAKKSAEIEALKTAWGLDLVYLQALLGLSDPGDLSPPWRRLGVVAQESLD